MAATREHWTLDDAIDFEAAVAAWDGSKPSCLQPAPGQKRSSVFKQWLATQPAPALGAPWTGALSLAGGLGVLAALAGGAGAAWATLDRPLAGVNVVWFLAGTLVAPWVLLVAGLAGWAVRGRQTGGWLGRLLRRLADRLAGGRVAQVLEQAQASGELARAMGWRVARHLQLIAAAFHAGAVGGLTAMVMFTRVGFFWETTTATAMESLLNRAVRWSSAPWAWAWPDLLPDVAGARRGPEWAGGGESWWPFLLLTLVCWGLLPRLGLAGLAAWQERRALGRLSFQAPHHRRLWRALTGVTRGEDPSGPLDGALVIDLGGSAPDREALRPFLLRRLRLNPTGWEALGVLNASQEAAARAALRRAPGGVVVLTEGWALAPRQMEQTLRDVRHAAMDRRVVVLVGNRQPDGRLQPPTPDERAAWERFGDHLADTGVDLVFYQEGAE